MIGTLLAMTIAAGQVPNTEPLRPQFHFTAQKGWLNDPNGLAYYKGEYHLFFQHNPFGTQWGNMTWGHAVSKDLVHWNQLEEAIAPDPLGTIFSGSAAVDSSNSAKFGKRALVCIYTAAGGTSDLSKGKPFTQCLAYSNDGRNFTKYPGNPVLPHLEASNRDPKLIWYGPTKRWILALFLDGNRYALFSSPDLKDWRQTCKVEMPNASECPDFFELPIDGDKGRKRWVFWGGSGYYRVGTFDGTTFTPETGSIRSNFGNTGYASQTYFNDPKGRRIQIAWLNGTEFPGCAWNQQMGFPNELKLRSTAAGPRLTFQPVGEIKGLRTGEIHEKYGRYPSQSGLLDISCTLRVPREGEFNLLVNGQVIRYNARTHVLSALGKDVDVLPVDGKLVLRILADRASIEIYGQGGLVYMPIYALPVAGDRGLRVESRGQWRVDRLHVFELESAWQGVR